MITALRVMATVCLTIGVMELCDLPGYSWTERLVRGMFIGFVVGLAVAVILSVFE